MKNIQLEESVLDLILKGGTVVLHLEMDNTATVLIRMPKGEFIQDGRIGNEDNYFEYAWAHNYLESSSISAAGSFNNTLRGAKEKVSKEHYEQVNN